MKKDIKAALRLKAKEDRQYFADECVPVTSDSFVCLLEDAACRIERLETAIQKIYDNHCDTDLIVDVCGSVM